MSKVGHLTFHFHWNRLLSCTVAQTHWMFPSRILSPSHWFLFFVFRSLPPFQIVPLQPLDCACLNFLSPFFSHHVTCPSLPVTCFLWFVCVPLPPPTCLRVCLVFFLLFPCSFALFHFSCRAVVQLMEAPCCQPLVLAPHAVAGGSCHRRR